MEKEKISEKNDKIKEKAKQLKLENKVIFLGLRNDVQKVLQAFDIFIMPSIYEGLPVSSIEAQASGLKCVLSDSISNEANVTGNVRFISLDKSAKEWAEQIVSMLPYDRIDTSRKIAEAGYDIKTTAKQLTDFYLTL